VIAVGNECFKRIEFLANGSLSFDNELD